MKYQDKSCEICTTTFTPKGPSSKYCSSCALERKREAGRRGTNKYRLVHGLIKNPGVGSGNSQGKGEEHHSYKNGISSFIRKRRDIKNIIRYCERCNKDLSKVNRWGWVIHHKDHNRKNNVDSNFELLCKRCHQIEHDCHLAFHKTCND